MSEFDIDRIPDYMFHEAVSETLGGSNITKIREGYNFRCPICGDSKKNTHKKRGYVYTDKWKFSCYNECGSMSFLEFLKRFHNATYKKIIFHGFTHKPKKKKVEDVKDTSGSKVYKFKEGELISLYVDNPISKKALEYCTKRQILKQVYDKWFVCIKDDKFLDRDSKGNILKDLERGYALGNEYGDRLIIPYYRLGGKWSQFDARTLVDAVPKYKNVTGVDREMYNIDFIDVNKPFFLLEGSINATFIENSVSFGGTQHLMPFLEQHPELLKNKHNGTIIWDNDDAGYDELSARMDLGFNWFNWSKIKPLEEFRYIEKENGDIIERIIDDVNDMKMYSYTELDDNGYLSYNFLKKYIEKPAGGAIKICILYGDREKRKRKKFNDFIEKNKKQESSSVRYIGKHYG